jgi:hypothetical protein
MGKNSVKLSATLSGLSIMSNIGGFNSKDNWDKYIENVFDKPGIANEFDLTKQR